MANDLLFIHYTPSFLASMGTPALDEMMKRREGVTNERRQLDKELRQYIFERKQDEYVMCTPEEIGKAVQRYLSALYEIEPSSDYVSSHLGYNIPDLEGVSVSVGSVSETNPNTRGLEGKIRVTIYAHASIAGKYHTEERHQLNKEAVAEHTGMTVAEEWNGKDGQEGISFILDREAPLSLSTAEQNYNSGVVGSEKFTAFTEAVNAKLAELDGKPTQNSDKIFSPELTSEVEAFEQELEEKNSDPYEVVVRRKVHAAQKDLGWIAVKMYASKSSAKQAIKKRGMHLMEYEICTHPLTSGGDKYCVHFACEELEDVIECRNRGFAADYMGFERVNERLNAVVVR